MDELRSYAKRHKQLFKDVVAEAVTLFLLVGINEESARKEVLGGAGTTEAKGNY